MIGVFQNIPMYQKVHEYLDIYFSNDLEPINIPVLGKGEIAKSFPHNYMTEEVRAAIKEGQVEYASTSGTTSERLMLMRRRGWWREEFERGYKYNPDMADYSMYRNKKACLSTAVCSGNTCFRNNPTFEERKIGNTLYLNVKQDPNTWTKKDILQIDRELKEFSAELLEVDPVYLSLFLKKRHEFDVPGPVYQPRYITCSYEYLTQRMRQYLEEAFSCPILDLYGSTELGVLFIQDASRRYHRCPERSIIELIPINPNLHIYKLVVTSWKNELMPLLRYDTNDLVELTDAEHARVIEISKYKFMEHEPLEIASLHGRMNDAFLNDDGELITVAMLDNELQKCGTIPWQWQLEFIDKRVVFRYVPDGKDKHSEIQSENFSFLQCWFSRHLTIDCIPVGSIRNESSGKFSLIKGENSTI